MENYDVVSSIEKSLKKTFDCGQDAKINIPWNG